MLTTVAVQQQIFDITGSSAWVGFASLVALVPLVVFGLLGGAIADTYDRRKLLMITSVGIALTSIGLWIAALIATESVWPVLALLAVQQGFFAVNQPTRSAIIPQDRAGRHGAGRECAGHDGVQHRGDRRAAAGRHADPAGRAGLAVLHRRAHAGGDPVRGDQAAADPAAGRARGRAKVMDGIAYLRLQPLLLMTFVVDIIAMVCGMPRALFPQMAQETFGGPPGGGLALGMLNAGLAIGSLLGGLTGGWIHRVYRQGIAIVAAILLWGVSMALFGTDVGALARRAVPGDRRLVGPGQRRVPVDDPAGERHRRDARPDPGGVHRGGGRRSAVGRPGARGGGRRDVDRLRGGRRRDRDDRADPGRGRAGPVAVAVRLPRAFTEG